MNSLPRRHALPLAASLPPDQGRMMQETMGSPGIAFGLQACWCRRQIEPPTKLRVRRVDNGTRQRYQGLVQRFGGTPMRRYMALFGVGANSRNVIRILCRDYHMAGIALLSVFSAWPSAKSPPSSLS